MNVSSLLKYEIMCIKVNLAWSLRMCLWYSQLHHKACNVTHLFMSPFLSFSTASPNRVKWVTTPLKQAGQSLESHLSFCSHTHSTTVCRLTETDVQIDVQLPDSYSQNHRLFRFMYRTDRTKTASSRNLKSFFKQCELSG